MADKPLPVFQSKHNTWTITCGHARKLADFVQLCIVQKYT